MLSRVLSQCCRALLHPKLMQQVSHAACQDTNIIGSAPYRASCLCARNCNLHAQMVDTKPACLLPHYKQWQLDVCIPVCVHRVNSWSSLTGSPKKSGSGKGLTILADTDAPVQPDSAAGSSADRDLAATKRLGSVRFAAPHLQPDSPSGSSITGRGLASICPRCVTVILQCS